MCEELEVSVLTNIFLPTLQNSSHVAMCLVEVFSSTHFTVALPDSQLQTSRCSLSYKLQGPNFPVLIINSSLQPIYNELFRLPFLHLYF